MNDSTGTPRYTLWQMVLYMLRLGTLGFGGPVALVGYMHRDLVENRRWIGETDYKEGLALSQLAPGRWPRNSAFTWTMFTIEFLARPWPASRSLSRPS